MNKKQHSDFDYEMQERLRLLLNDHSQSDIARATGISVSSVNHYMLGRKSPAEFCALLVEKLGVNPAWLLAGEGTPYMSDVTTGAEATASHLLEVVQAMNAVMKMKLGALTGNEHLKVLRKLDDSLLVYERLRDDLDQQSTAFFTKLIGEFTDAIRRRDFSVAESLRHAAKQVSRLCGDEALHARFDSLQSFLEFEFGNRQLAAELQRRVFHDTFLKYPSDKEVVISAANFVSLLHSSDRVEDARRICRAVLALVPEDLDDIGVLRLRFAEGSADIELGDMVHGMAKLQYAYNRFPKDWKLGHRHIYSKWMLFSGGVTFLELMAADRACISEWTGAARHRQPHTMRFLACWFEELPLLQEALDLYTNVMVSAAPTVESQYPPYLAEALRTKSKNVVKKFLQDETVREAAVKFDSSFSVHVIPRLLAQLERIIGDNDAALEQTLIYDQSLLESQPGISLFATHYRGALALIPANSKNSKLSALRQRAQQFFDTHYANGYMIFEPFASAVLRKRMVQRSY